MRPNAYAPVGLYDTLSAQKPQRAAVARFITELVDGWKAARADREARFALASLDDTTLRDIGVESDEIQRLRTTEAFLPRRWSDRT